MDKIGEGGKRARSLSFGSPRGATRIGSGWKRATLQKEPRGPVARGRGLGLLLCRPGCIESAMRRGRGWLLWP